MSIVEAIQSIDPHIISGLESGGPHGIPTAFVFPESIRDHSPYSMLRLIGPEATPADLLLDHLGNLIAVKAGALRLGEGYIEAANNLVPIRKADGIFRVLAWDGKQLIETPIQFASEDIGVDSHRPANLHLQVLSSVRDDAGKVLARDLIGLIETEKGTRHAVDIHIDAQTGTISISRKRRTDEDISADAADYDAAHKGNATRKRAVTRGAVTVTTVSVTSIVINIACGGVATEPIAQPPIQRVTQEVATAQPANALETAATANTVAAEVAASPTPPTMEELARGGGYSLSEQNEMQQQALADLYDFVFFEKVQDANGNFGTRFDQFGGQFSLMPFDGGAYAHSPQLDALPEFGNGMPSAFVNFGDGSTTFTSVDGANALIGVKGNSLEFADTVYLVDVVVDSSGNQTSNRLAYVSRPSNIWTSLQNTFTEATATPAPSETPIAPSPEPSQTPEPTKTPEPTEIPPSPTPEQLFQPWGVWPSQEEITAALQEEPNLNSYPLKLHEFGLPWYQLNGLITNPRQIDLVIAGRFEISLAYDFYYDPNNPEAKVTMPLYGYDRVEDRWMTFVSGSTISGRMSTDMYPEVFGYVFGNKNTVMKKGVAFIDREEFKNYRPPHYNGGIGQTDLVALIHDALGVTKEDFDHFIQTGDPSTLPKIDGEIWLFPNQVDDRN